MTVRNRLKILIKENDLQIKDVMLGKGLSRNTLSHIVNNPESSISNKTIDLLCMFFEITPGEFFEFKRNMKS